MKRLLILLKGIIIGFISCAIPGLSALTFAILLYIYFPLVDALSNVFKNFKKSIVFIILFFSGYIIGAALAATLVSTLYDKFPLIIICTIFGFVIGCLPKMVKDVIPYMKKVSVWIVFFVIVGIFFTLQTIFKVSESVNLETMNITTYIIIFFVGIVCSITFAFPGFDYKILLLSLGFYYSLMESIKNVTTFQHSLSSLLFVGVYVAGYMIGIFILSRFIKILNNKFPGQVKAACLALVMVSPYTIVKNCIIDNANFYYTRLHLILGIVLGVIAMITIFLINFLHNPHRDKHDAANNQFVFKLFIDGIFNVFTRHKYFKRIKKAINDKSMSFNDKYTIIQEILTNLNFKAKIKPKIKGDENIPNDVSMYVVNHQGRYDAFAILSALNNKPSKLMVKDEFFTYPYSKDILKLLECIPLNNDTPNNIEVVQDVLNQNINLIVFIQNGIVEANTLRYFKPSILDIAYNAKVNIVPVLLYDSYLVYHKDKKEFVEPEIHFLQSINYEEYKDIPRSELAKSIKQSMFEEMDAIKYSKEE